VVPEFGKFQQLLAFRILNHEGRLAMAERARWQKVAIFLIKITRFPRKAGHGANPGMENAPGLSTGGAITI
jgi:hypothetical protein